MIGDPHCHLGIVFEGLNWNSDQLYALYVLGYIFGQSSSFSSGGPGKGMHSRTTRVLNRISYLDHFAVTPEPFSDSGLFSFVASGDIGSLEPMAHIVSKVITESREDIGPEEFERGKNIFKSNVLLSFELQNNRLEEMTRNYRSCYSPKIYDYISGIDKVTYEEAMEVYRTLTSTKPAIVLCSAYNKELQNIDVETIGKKIMGI